MKITVKDKQYTIMWFSSETTKCRFFLFPIQETFVYCYDKEGKPYKFLATEIVKYG
jgi:hypothetical protein